MGSDFSIITVGLCPAWDITCRGAGLKWGEHQQINEQSVCPAGKALNISRALAWMGKKNVAAGLWGREDFGRMLEAMRPLAGAIKIKMTAADGATRQNVTIVDTAKRKEMHLRCKSELADRKSLGKLKVDLQKILGRESLCVFAGSMPDAYVNDIVDVINCCRSGGARIALDTSGTAMKRLVDGGGIWLIKPNVEELGELLGKKVRDDIAGLAKAASGLLDRVRIVLISRGGKGAIVVTKDRVLSGRCLGGGKVLSTVACGDYLLAGFLKGLEDRLDMGFALETAIKVATAKALGWTESESWAQAERQIKVVVRQA